MMLVDILALLYGNKIFYVIWVLCFFNPSQILVIETKHPCVIIQEVFQTCQCFQSEQGRLLGRQELREKRHCCVLPPWSSDSLGTCGKEVGQVTSPEILIYWTCGSGHQDLASSSPVNESAASVENCWLQKACWAANHLPGGNLLRAEGISFWPGGHGAGSGKQGAPCSPACLVWQLFPLPLLPVSGDDDSSRDIR